MTKLSPKVLCLQHCVTFDKNCEMWMCRGCRGWLVNRKPNITYFATLDELKANLLLGHEIATIDNAMWIMDTGTKLTQKDGMVHVPTDVIHAEQGKVRTIIAVKSSSNTMIYTMDREVRHAVYEERDGQRWFAPSELKYLRMKGTWAIYHGPEDYVLRKHPPRSICQLAAFIHDFDAAELPPYIVYGIFEDDPGCDLRASAWKWFGMSEQERLTLIIYMANFLSQPGNRFDYNTCTWPKSTVAEMEQYKAYDLPRLLA